MITNSSKERRKNNEKNIINRARNHAAFGCFGNRICGAAITKEAAQEIALKDAGYSASDAVRIKTEYEFDDGRETWNVDFLVEENGLYKDYDYEILASDGTIVEKDWEYEDDFYFVPDVPSFGKFEKFFAKFIEWILSIIK